MSAFGHNRALEKWAITLVSADTPGSSNLNKPESNSFEQHNIRLGYVTHESPLNIGSNICKTLYLRLAAFIWFAASTTRFFLYS